MRATESSKTKYHEIDPAMNQITEAVIGAAIEVHRHLGPGFQEITYERALCIEMETRGIPFERQHPIRLTYKGHIVGEGKLDLLIAGKLIVELKSVETLNPVHEAQVISYLRASGHTLGLLINFDVPVLVDGVKRIIHTQPLTSNEPKSQ